MCKLIGKGITLHGQFHGQNSGEQQECEPKGQGDNEGGEGESRPQLIGCALAQEPRLSLISD